MARFITSLDNYNREDATPEEVEAYRVSHEALHNRMQSYLRRAEVSRRMATPVTDAFGRPIRQTYNT